MKLQVAFEYMVVVSLVFAFLIPLWIYINIVQTRTNTELSLSYAQNAVDKITTTADLVYSQGMPAKVKLSIYIPDNVNESMIVNNTVVLKVLTTSGITDVYSTSKAQLNGTLPTEEGNYWMYIEAKEDFVQITVM